MIYPFDFVFCNKMAAFRGACFNLGKETALLRLTFSIQKQNVIKVDLHLNRSNYLSTLAKGKSSAGNDLKMCIDNPKLRI